MTDQKMEVIVANLLRTGVTIAAAVVFIGGIGYLVQHGHEPAAYRNFQPSYWQWRDTSPWRVVIQLGLVILIATPIARVAFALVAFGLERDRVYVMITAIVLAILLYSLIASH
jgi:uncharacterized membrane protein